MTKIEFANTNSFADYTYIPSTQHISDKLKLTHDQKENQKKIIIGKNGLKIKQIGIDARKAISEIYDCKINLTWNL